MLLRFGFGRCLAVPFPFCASRMGSHLFLFVCDLSNAVPDHLEAVMFAAVQIRRVVFLRCSTPFLLVASL